MMMPTTMSTPKTRPEGAHMDLKDVDPSVLILLDPVLIAEEVHAVSALGHVAATLIPRSEDEDVDELKK